MRRRGIFAVLASIALLVSGLTVVGGPPQSASAAADGRLFNPGNIISDALFFDGGAMNLAEVQGFLNSRVPTCRAGYTCLKSYHQATPSRAQVNGRCFAYQGSPDESAAAIITRVGAACGISQKALIVLLEKEQGLVTDTWPSAGQYRSATGYGCPDTAACDSTYYGFFNQVYAAALQFKRYAATPTSWNHVAGQVNNVRFSPNASCGSSQVFIQNQATAGLYNYTPYQPNAAALANLYGTGDGCSSYGNRNFWRMYSDWFGSPTGGSSLARTTTNSTVYLISDKVKYPVPSEALLGALAPLGQVGYVSQSYLDSFATKQPLGRVLRSPGGAIYFFDSGYKLSFGSCDLVADYGGACADGGYAQLTDTQLAAFATGPAMTQVMGTSEGARYFVDNGVKQEILDAASQTAAGIPVGMNVLTESALSTYPLGTPIVRDSVVVQERGQGDYSLLANGQRSAMDSTTASATGVATWVVGSLWPSSMTKIPSASAAFNGAVKVGSSTTKVLSSGRSYDWTAGNLPATGVNQAFVDAFPASGSLSTGTFAKSTSDSRVYVVMGGSLRPVSSWDVLASVSKASNPPILSLAPPSIAALPQGAAVLASGSLVRSQDNPTVYLINGLTNRIALSSFDMATEAGFTSFSYVSNNLIQGYQDSGAKLGYGVTCNGVNYLSAGGAIHQIPASKASAYPLTFSLLDAYSCADLKIGTPVTSFIRTPDGKIFQMLGGQKRPIGSLDRFAQLGGWTEGYLDVTPGFAATIPLGPAA